MVWECGKLIFMASEEFRHPQVVQENNFVRGPFVAKGRRWAGAVRNSIVAQDVALAGRKDFESKLTKRVLKDEAEYQRLKILHFTKYPVTTVNENDTLDQKSVKARQYDVSIRQFESQFKGRRLHILENHRFYKAAEHKYFKGYTIEESRNGTGKEGFGFADFNAPVILASEKIATEQNMGLMVSMNEIKRLVKDRYESERRNGGRGDPRRGKLQHLVYLAQERYLQSLKDIAVGKTVAAEWVVEEAFSRDTLEQNSLRDPLTGAFNRAAIGSDIGRALDILNAGGDEFVVIFFDVDDFKSINDREPRQHAAGDDTLKGIFPLIGGVIGPLGVVGRWGGEEGVGMAAISDPEQILNMAYDVGTTVKSQLADNIRSGGEIFVRGNITISLGVLRVTRGMSYSDIVNGADNLMYQAKKHGKNGMCWWEGNRLMKRDFDGGEQYEIEPVAPKP